MKIEIQQSYRCSSVVRFKHIIQLILALSLLSVPIKSQICEYCQSALEYQCKSCNSFCSEQKMSVFNKCTYVNCTQNRQNLCKSYQQLQPNVTVDSCNQNCCGDRVPLSSVILKRCLNQQSSNPHTIIIGLSAFAGVSVLGVLAGILYYKYKTNKLPCFKNPYNSQNNKNRDTVQQNEEQIHESSSSSALQDEKIKQQVCSICLDGGLDTMTNCNHYFHAVCLANWYKRNQKCPICKNIKINPVTLHCAKCQRKCRRLNIFKLMKQWQFLGKWLGTLCLSCTNA